MRSLVFLSLIFWSIAGAQNLVLNPDFNDGLADWSAQPSAVADLEDGYPSPPSAELFATPFNEAPPAVLSSSCVAVDLGKNYVLSANLKFIVGTGSMGVMSSASSDCSSSIAKGLNVAYTPTTNGWLSAAASDIAFDDSTKFVQVIFVCPGSGCTLLIDHVDFQVQGSTSVSLQSFGVE
jgi:hypothetical protein